MNALTPPPNLPDPVPARTGTGWAVAPNAYARCTTWTYVASASIHPANLFVLVGTILLIASHWSVPALILALGIETAFLAVVPRCAFFRRSVHASIAQADRAAARQAREGLILQMSEQHRRELSTIEGLLEAALANAKDRCGAVVLSARDPEDMARLTLDYIRLAVDYCACAQALAMTNPETLMVTIRTIESAEAAQPVQARPLLRRWVSIANRRAMRWAQMHAHLETTRCQLAAITDLAYLLHQESLIPTSSRLTREIDGTLADFEQRSDAEREIADLGIDDDTCEVPPTMLAV